MGFRGIYDLSKKITLCDVIKLNKGENENNPGKHVVFFSLWQCCPLMEISHVSSEYAPWVLYLIATTCELYYHSTLGRSDIIMGFTIKIKKPLWWPGYVSMVVFCDPPSAQKALSISTHSAKDPRGQYCCVKRMGIDSDSHLPLQRATNILVYLLKLISG